MQTAEGTDQMKQLCSSAFSFTNGHHWNDYHSDSTCPIWCFNAAIWLFDETEAMQSEELVPCIQFPLQ